MRTAARIDSIQDLLLILVPSSISAKKRLVICDTNVLIHNLNVLEHPSCAIANIVIPQTALLECRHRSFTAYTRVVELIRSSSSNNNSTDSSPKSKNQMSGSSPSHQQIGERSVIFFPDVHHTETQIPVRRSMETIQNNTQSKLSTINDENDQRIRLVANFFGKAFDECSTDEGKVEVVLLSDDKLCRDLARKEQMEYLKSQHDDNNEDNAESKVQDEDLLYAPKSVRQHVKELQNEDPDLSLLDLVANFSSSSSSSAASKKKEQIFTPHLSQKELSIGVKAGTYFQGNIRAERGSHHNCYVTVRKGEDRIAVRIIGSHDINRAVNGDIVVVQLHPVSKWFSGYYQ